MPETPQSRGAATGVEFVEARDKALQRLFAPNEKVWLVNQHYDAIELIWDVDLVRPVGPQNTWMRQRYEYDTSADILHFRGERPLNDEEFSTCRKQGKRIH